MLKKLINHFKYMVCNNRGAVDFQGTDDKCQTLSSPISAYPFSIYCRFKANALGAGYIFSLSNSGTSGNYIDLIHGTSNYTVDIRSASGGTPNATGWIRPTFGVTDLNWHTFIMVSTASNSHFFYLDGILVASSSVTAVMPILNRAQVAHWVRSGNTSYGNTIIDEFAVWNTNISSGNIATLNGTGIRDANSILPGNLKLSWILDQTTIGLSADGATVSDESSNGFDGTIDDGANNSGTMSVDGPYTPLLTQDINEDITVTDVVQITSDIDKHISTDITVTDEIQVLPTITTNQSEDITVDDSIALDVGVDHEADITVTDEISINVDLEKFQGSEDITVSDAINVYATTGPASFASKIISFNPLIIIADTAPLKIVRVDVTDPVNPTWQKYKINGVDNPKDVVYDSVLDLIFVVCANGQILQIDANDFSNYTIFDTGDLNHLLNIAIFEGYYRVFAGTDDPDGELITLDNRFAAKMGISVQCLQVIKTGAQILIDSVNAKSIGTNVQVLGIKKGSVGIDVRIIPQPNLPEIITDPILLFDGLAENPIKQTDFHVYVDGVEFTDVELDSINIYHTIGEKSTAGFKLRRRHDNFNKTIDGTSVVIDQQNVVSITIKGREEFIGNITTLNTFSEDEIVEVICLGEEKTNERRKITIPMTELNEKLGLYDCLVHDPVHYDPIIDPNDEDPQFYKGIRVDLGTKITPNVRINNHYSGKDSYFLGSEAETLAKAIREGTFQPDQNWTYFWKISAYNYYTGITYTDLKYTGSSFNHLSTDLWKITGASFKRQIKFRDIQRELGFYELGEAPFKEISIKNGKLIVVRSYQDGKANWEQIFSEGYNYTGYATLVAGLEYEKLQTINDEILPIASANLGLLLDAYFYYGVKLLTRINIDNTIEAGIFKNNHGFPVAVKSISISSSNMQVSLNCDNGKSQVELEEIDARYPDSDDNQYKYDKQTWFLAPKFDFNKATELESDEVENRG